MRDVLACPACGQPAPPEAKYCSRCGLRLDPTAPLLPVKPAKIPWYYNVWVVVFLLFFALGPFGLPLVWKNPRLSKPVKIGLTLAVLLYTAWFIVLLIRMAQAVSESLRDFDASLHF